MLPSGLCNYCDSYIIVEKEISVTCTNNANKIDKKITFKNNAPFRSCISQINNAFADNAKYLDIVMPMCNVWHPEGCGVIIEVRSIMHVENNDDNYWTNNDKTTTDKSFEYKTKIIGRTSDNNNRLDSEILVPLKYSDNIWRYSDFLLINYEIEFDLSWSKTCTISALSINPEVSGNNLAEATLTTGEIFQINNVKLSVLVVISFIKQEFRRTITWDKYRSETLQEILQEILLMSIICH